nr:MAG TPA: hypothetical protein [Caudoviricetes sp.]
MINNRLFFIFREKWNPVFLKRSFFFLGRI